MRRRRARIRFGPGRPRGARIRFSPVRPGSPERRKAVGEALGIVKGTLELVVLRALAAQAPMHGFAILEWVRATTDDDLVVEDGALYPALRRMEERGWVESEWAVSEKGRRARYYELTPLGRKALSQEDALWKRYVAAMAKLGGEPA
jgi:transcriptional regulator